MTRALVGGFAAIQALTANAAEPVKPAAPTGQCRGTDMLAELETKEPAIFRDVMAAASQLGNTEALLWKIEKPGVAPSHLFGTVHLSDERVSTLQPKVREALHNSKTLTLEVADLSDNALAAAMGNAETLLMYTDGKTLAEALSSDEYKQVQAIVEKSGMPGEFAGMLKPWLVNMLLAISDCERKQVASGATVLDMRLAEEAQKRGIPVSGLESIEQQLDALAGVPDDQQIQMLRAGLKYVDRTDDMMETLLQLYLKRQIGAAMPFQIALAAKSGTPATAFEGFQKTLLVDRNVGMAEKARQYLDAGQAFIAVGALHLPGETGLVALLRKAGYTVTPIE